MKYYVVGIVTLCALLAGGAAVSRHIADDENLAYLAKAQAQRIEEANVLVRSLNAKIAKLEEATIWSEGDKVFHLQGREVYVVIKEGEVK